MQSTFYFFLRILWIFFRQNFEKYSNIKLDQNLLSGSRIGPCGWTDGRGERQTDMTKLIVGFRSFSKAPKKKSIRKKCTWPTVL